MNAIGKNGVCFEAKSTVTYNRLNWTVISVFDGKMVEDSRGTGIVL